MPDIGTSKESLKQVAGLVGEFVGTTDTQSLTIKTFNVDLNTLTSNTPSAGNLLKSNGTKLVPLPRGTANQPLKVNTGGTDLDYGTLPVAGGGTGVTTLTGIVKGSGTGPLTTVAAPAGAILGDNDTQTIRGPTTFMNQTLKFRNIADTFSLTIVNPPITADRQLTLPTLTGNDTFVTQAHPQVLTNKSFDNQIKVKPITVPATDAAYGQYYVDSADANKPKFKKPDGTVIDLAAAATGAQLNVSNTWTANQIFANNIALQSKDSGGTIRSMMYMTGDQMVIGESVGVQNLYIYTGNATPAFRIDNTNLILIGPTNLPLKNVSNTWTALQIFRYDAGNDTVMLYKGTNVVDSATGIIFRQNNSGGVDRTYGGIYSAISNNTAGSETGYMMFQTTIAGALGTKLAILPDGQVRVGYTNNQNLLDIYRPASNGSVAIQYSGQDSATAYVPYGFLIYIPTDVTAGSVDTEFVVYRKVAGADIDVFRVGDNTLLRSPLALRANVQEVISLIRTSTTPDSLYVTYYHNNASGTQVDVGYVGYNVYDTTAGSEDSDFLIWLKANGSLIQPFYVANDGQVYLGGPNRRVILTDGGLTTQRQFSFPDASTKLAGVGVNNAFTTQQTIRYDAGNDTLYLYRVNNIVDGKTSMLFTQKDSANNDHTYAVLYSGIAANTNGAESGYFEIHNSVAGTLAKRLSIGGTGETTLGFTNIQHVLGIYRPVQGGHADIRFRFDNATPAITDYGSIGFTNTDATPGSEDSNLLIWQKSGGADINCISTDNTGQLYCGGSTRRVGISEFGLSTTRIYTFPNASGEVVTRNTGFLTSSVFTEPQQITTNSDEVLFKMYRVNKTIGAHVYHQYYLNNASDAAFPAGHMGFELSVNTAGAESTDFYFSNRYQGNTTTPLAITANGSLYCGGPGRRVIITETGLTDFRFFTFPDATTKLVGVSVQNVYATGNFQIFPDNTIAIQNPASTFTYRIRGSAIVADRDLTLPLINGPDTVAVLSLAQTMSNKNLSNTTGLSFTEGANIVAGTATGTKIGTGTTQKLGFFNATPVIQQTGIADVSTNTVDATYDSNEQTVITSLRTKVNAILAVLEALGFTAVA